MPEHTKSEPKKKPGKKKETKPGKKKKRQGAHMDSMTLDDLDSIQHAPKPHLGRSGPTLVPPRLYAWLKANGFDMTGWMSTKKMKE